MVAASFRKRPQTFKGGADEAVRELQRARIDILTLSVVAKESHTDEHVVLTTIPATGSSTGARPAPFGEASGDCETDIAAFDLSDDGHLLLRKYAGQTRT